MLLMPRALAVGYYGLPVRWIGVGRGAPKQLLIKLARDGTAVVGGSFLAQRGSSVYNSSSSHFLAADPLGSLARGCVCVDERLRNWAIRRPREFVQLTLDCLCGPASTGPVAATR